MSVTLLLDLDDTLLANRIQTFLPAYMQALEDYFAGYVEPKKFSAALLAATRKTFQNTRPDCTLKEVFEAAFFPTLKMPVEIYQEMQARFYATVFPSLQSLTQPVPGAAPFVEWALGQSYHLAIATNPLFPRIAIDQRLAWAGLSPQAYPFDLVASYETFHFAKPNPAFYAETVARLGWPEGVVVMAGDDLERDIFPARRLGLPAFWITPSGATPPDGPLAPSGQGSLEDLRAWLESDAIPLTQPSSPAALEATLRSTPATLDSLCRDLPGQAWVQRSSPDEWSLAEIICHIRDVDREVNLPRLEVLLSEDNPFLQGKDTDPWAEQRDYHRQNGPQALHTFILTRIDVLDFLGSLTEEDWERPARHALLGPTHLQELVSIIGEHDRLHIRQVQRLLSALAVL